MVRSGVHRFAEGDQKESVASNFVLRASNGGAELLFVDALRYGTSGSGTGQLTIGNDGLH